MKCGQDLVITGNLTLPFLIPLLRNKYTASIKQKIKRMAGHRKKMINFAYCDISNTFLPI